MLIKVTQEDINNGRPLKSCECPVALACKRALNVDKVYIDGYSVTIYSDDHLYYVAEYKLPYNAAEFIEDFDGDHAIAPFEFELDI